MAVFDAYFRNTQTNAGTGGIIYDLSSTFTISTTLNTGNLNSETFTEMLAWQRTVNSTINDTTFAHNVVVEGLSGTLEWRFRIQRVNSSNVVQASSAYSATYSTATTATDTLTLSTTWSSGDRIRVSFEIRRSAGHGNVACDTRVNQLSYVIYDIFDTQRRIMGFN